MVLTPEQARKFYDRFGKKQDTQDFYEDASLDDLIAHADFRHAEHVFEFGCGTGRFASRLLSQELSSSATYLGVDLSQTMISIAEPRVASFAARAKVMQTDGSMTFPLADESVDRVISTYVFDLLSDEDMQRAVAEAYRVLIPTGTLCIVSLTHGTTLLSRMVSGVWSFLCRLYAPMVGGCRPIKLKPLLDPEAWSVQYQNRVKQFGVTSEVLIAEKKGA